MKMLSDRMRLVGTLAAACLMFALSPAAQAQSNAVTVDITFPLRLPEFGICLGRYEPVPAGMHVPEASVNINDFVKPGKH